LAAIQRKRGLLVEPGGGREFFIVVLLGGVRGDYLYGKKILSRSRTGTRERAYQSHPRQTDQHRIRGAGRLVDGLVSRFSIT